MVVVASDLRLRPVQRDDEQALLAAHQLLQADGFQFLLGHDPTEPWSRYVRRLADQRRGVGLEPGWVAATFLVAVVGPDIVGRVSVRHELNDYLAFVGGHIGYGVLPGFRRRGYATELLRHGVLLARAAGVGRILVTCDEGNIASSRAIERCGGVFESSVDDPDDGHPVRRYWID